VNTPDNLELTGGNPAFVAAAEVPNQDASVREHPPWGLLAALLTWFASVALLFLPQFLALPYIMSHYRGQRPTAEVLLADKTVIVILIAGILPAHLITLAIAWAVATRFGKVPAKAALRWAWGNRMGFLRSVVVAVILFAAAWLIVLAFGGRETELERIINSSRAAALLIAFMAVATAPLVEEIVYRGILFPAWQRLIGSVPAVIIVTLMFAIPHVPQYWPNLAVIFSITLLSATLTTIRARTRRLLPCYVIHLVFNGIQAVVIVADPYLRSLGNPPQPKAAPAILYSLLTFF
jgi:membrane protease YdiL (CAAX protease family)